MIEGYKDPPTAQVEVVCKINLGYDQLIKSSDKA